MELPSRYSPLPCWKCETAVGSSAICKACGALQDLPEALSFFEVLGLPMKLRLSEEELRERFYEISRRVHPDRFVQASPKEVSFSSRWSTAVNKAYQTLRDPWRRARYVVDLHETREKKSTGIPTELAEAYFELQDLLDEPEGKDRMREFRDEMRERLEKTEAEWNTLADNDSLTRDPKVWAVEMQNLLSIRKTLQSMIADLESKL